MRSPALIDEPQPRHSPSYRAVIQPPVRTTGADVPAAVRVAAFLGRPRPISSVLSKKPITAPANIPAPIARRYGIRVAANPSPRHWPIPRWPRVCKPQVELGPAAAAPIEGRPRRRSPRRRAQEARAQPSVGLDAWLQTASRGTDRRASPQAQIRPQRVATLPPAPDYPRRSRSDGQGASLLARGSATRRTEG